MKNTHMAEITKNWEKAKKFIEEGKIVVAPTDTIYGILADASNPEVVEYVYRLKSRKEDKPYIILIPDVHSLSFFGIKPSKEEEKLLSKKGITVVVQLSEKNSFEYLHRGKKTLAFRIPEKKELIELMEKTEKPLIAPSANPEGKEPAKSVKEAYAYFKDKVHLYIDEGFLEGKPSTIVLIKNGKPVVLREGNTKKEEIEKILKN